MSLLLPVLAPLGGGAAFTIVAIYLFTSESLATRGTPRPATDLAGD